MALAGKRAVVVGLGSSGVAATWLLSSRGAHVVAADRASFERLSTEARALEGTGVELALGDHDPALFDGADLCVVSPGVPSFPALEAFERGGGEVIGELELASRFLDAPIALIGGTNGKSTTVALVGAMMTAAGKRTFVGGNFGTPLSQAVGATHDVLVVEISSFQAERVPSLHARAHALLNVTPDHLDRYPSLEAYADAKGNPFVRMTSEDTAVVPSGDDLVLRQARRGEATLVTFGFHDVAAPGAPYRTAEQRSLPDVRIERDRIVDTRNGASFSTRDMRISGTHNLANAAAAVAVATSLGAPTAAIAEALAKFEGLAHRTVLVAEIAGVRYYDDSKGTNVGASVAALRGLIEPKAVLIAGGRDKLGAYDELVDALRDKGRALVLIGEAADRIEAAVRGTLPIARASSMADAVRAAADLATVGDAVLLSPACSSFDMFRDYKDRGDAFVRAVHTLSTTSRSD